MANSPTSHGPTQGPNLNGQHHTPPPRPTAPRVCFENIPDQLKKIAQWVGWSYLYRPGQEKPWTKPPKQANGKPADVTDPATWGTFEKIKEAYENGLFDGIGFAVTANAGIIGVDMDDQRAEDGEWSAEVKAQINALQTYGEISPSGNGVRFFGFGTLPPTGRKRDKFEAYDGAHYLTVTGHQLPGTPETVEDCGAALLDYHARLIAQKAPPKNTERGATPAPKAPQTPLDLSDAEVIEKARSATNGAKFSALWDDSHGGDASAADLALCSILRFWTRADAARIDSLFRDSGLMRDKWDAKHRSDGATYGQITIEKALSKGGEVYNPQRNGAGAATKTSAPKPQRGEAQPTGETSPEAKVEASESNPEGKKSQAETLLEIALAEAETFRDRDDEAFATIKGKGGARLTYRLNSTAFRAWLSGRHYETFGRMVSSSSAHAAVLDTIRGLLMGTPAREVYTRIAHQNGRIYYDLGDDSGRAVEIAPDGWKVCAAPPVAFIRPKGMRPQVEPQRGGSVLELRELLNVETDEDFALISGFLLGFFQPEGAKTHLGFLGEQGTAKSATTKTLRAILDPNDAPTRSEPREVGDLIVAAKNNAIIGFDNLSHIPTWFSDFLCRLSTGSGDGKRKLYENDEEVIFAFKRSAIFNAITEVATRPDLLDRTILIELPLLPEAKRRRESGLDRDFAESRPLILGALFDAVAIGLGRFAELEIKNLPRMADFAVWVEACAPGLGWEPEEFLNIYRQNRADTAENAAEISTLASFIIELWATEAQPTFKGSPKELLEILNRAAKPNYSQGHTTDIREAKDWPKDVRSLGRSLKRLAPILRAKGIFARDRKSNGGKIWEISAKGGQ